MGLFPAVLGMLLMAHICAHGAGPVGRLSSTITTNYYTFGGTNAAKLRAAMIEARPWKQTMNFDAHTKWHVQSNYRYQHTNGEHRLVGIEIKATVAITLPAWVPGKPVSRELVTRWQKCFLGLSAHEQGHLQLALAAAAEVKRRLEELPGFVSAQELKAAADRVFKETIEDFEERERAYDKVTGHGRTQGAIFPVEMEPEELLIPSAPSATGSPRRQSSRGR